MHTLLEKDEVLNQHPRSIDVGSEVEAIRTGRKPHQNVLGKSGLDIRRVTI